MYRTPAQRHFSFRFLPPWPYTCSDCNQLSDILLSDCSLLGIPVSLTLLLLLSSLYPFLWSGTRALQNLAKEKQEPPAMKQNPSGHVYIQILNRNNYTQILTVTAKLAEYDIFRFHLEQHTKKGFTWTKLLTLIQKSVCPPTCICSNYSLQYINPQLAGGT